jgi:hypothetical protein
MPWLWASADHANMTTLRVDVPAETVAFINGGSENRLWGRVYPAKPGAEQRAATEFAATALAAAAIAVGGSASGRQVAVFGDGMLAHLIRTSLPAEVLAAAAVFTTPRAADHMYDIVDTTGSASVLGDAVRTLPRLGRLVLAAPPCSAEITLATYGDIHVRGLSLVGVPWTVGLSGSAAASPRLPWLIEEVLTGIGRAWPSQPTPRNLLYALGGGTANDASHSAALPHPVDVVE